MTIKTREELIDYLYRCKRLKRYSFNIEDIKPLNSFVAKEALFSCEELAKIENKEIRSLFTVIENRRKLSSYGAYSLNFYKKREY